jgi:hypothetical protein
MWLYSAPLDGRFEVFIYKGVGACNIRENSFDCTSLAWFKTSYALRKIQSLPTLYGFGVIVKTAQIASIS